MSVPDWLDDLPATARGYIRAREAEIARLRAQLDAAHDALRRLLTLQEYLDKDCRHHAADSEAWNIARAALVGERQP